MLSVGLYAPCEPGPALPAGAVVQYGRELDKVVWLGRDGMGSEPGTPVGHLGGELVAVAEGVSVLPKRGGASFCCLFELASSRPWRSRPSSRRGRVNRFCPALGGPCAAVTRRATGGPWCQAPRRAVAAWATGPNGRCCSPRVNRLSPPDTEPPKRDHWSGTSARSDCRPAPRRVLPVWGPDASRQRDNARTGRRDLYTDGSTRRADPRSRDERR
jgi:hypothetical protein